MEHITVRWDHLRAEPSRAEPSRSTAFRLARSPHRSPPILMTKENEYFLAEFTCDWY
jgi:hypothetical protein